VKDNIPPGKLLGRQLAAKQASATVVMGKERRMKRRGGYGRYL